MITRSQKMRIGIMAGVGLAALALNSCGQKPAPAETIPAGQAKSSVASTGKPSSGAVQSMRVTRVAERNLSDEVSGTGRLVLREEAAVGTELAGYRVEKVYVDEGDWVKQGQPLAQLDDTLLRSQIAQAKATLAQQQANATFNDANLKRAQDLAKAGALAQSTLEQTQMQAATSRAAVMAAEASVNTMNAMEARMVLRAPVAGRVLQRSLRPGDISTPATQTPYFRIARDGLIELDAELPDAKLAQVKVNDVAHITLPAGKMIDGKVRFVSPRVDQSTSLGKARISLPYDTELRPGGFAKASFQGQARAILTVPASAIRYESGGPVLMVVGEGNKVARTPVKLGDRVGDYVTLIDGPKSGAIVLATGSAFTLDGDVIQPVEDEASAATSSPASAGAGVKTP